MSQETHTWPDLAISLYDRLTGRGAEIHYHFKDLEVRVPASTAENAPQARWRLDGSISITTRDSAQ